MGTWSHEPFGNDHACDWAAELGESLGYELIEQAFDQVIAAQDEDFIDADLGCEAHAAAKMLAQVYGDGTEAMEFLQDAVTWLGKTVQPPSKALIKKAILALTLLTAENSELNELWEEGEEYGDWKQNIEQLKAVLATRGGEKV